MAVSQFLPEARIISCASIILFAENSVVLPCDPQVGFVVQQAVEHIGGVADADIHHAGAERRVLVGDMGVEQPSRLAAVPRVDVPGAPRQYALGVAYDFEVIKLAAVYADRMAVIIPPPSTL